MSLTGGIQLAPLMVDIKADLTGFKSDMQKASTYGVAEAEKLSTKLSGITKVGEKFSSLGGKMTMGVTVPLTGIAIAAGKVGMDFEAQMSRVQAISGATGKEFNKLNKQAIDLGSSTAFSATEAAQGMENLASAGFNVNEIMEAMPGMMDLAASSGEDLASSADIAASTLRGFGLEASQAGHVADVLAKNASATNAAVSDTGEAMKYIAPVAKAMGLSLEETTSAIGIMANAGIKGSEAGTALRQSLVRLASPSQEAADKMQAIGFNAFDAQGKLLPLNQIIGNLQNSTKSLTDEQKQNAIATIFGSESLSGMLTLMDAGPGQINELTDSLKNSDGAAKEMATTMQDNAKSSVEQMVGSLETAAIKIEKSVAPTITKIANYVGDLADKFSNLSADQQENILKWTAIALAAGPALKILGGGISTVGTLGKGILTLSNIIKGTTTVTGALTSASTVAAGASGMGGMVTTMGSALLTCAPLAAGIAVVATAFEVVKTENELANKSILETTDNMSLFEQAVNALSGGFHKSNEELIEMGIKYEEFSSDVTPSFRQAVVESADRVREFNQILKDTSLDGVITAQESDALSKRVAEACQNAINTINSYSDPGKKALVNAFGLDGTIDVNEQNVIDSYTKTGEVAKEEVTKLGGEINELEKQQQVEFSKEREEKIKADYQRIEEIRLTSEAKTEADIKAMHTNWLEQIETISAEKASEYLAARAEEREANNADTLEKNAAAIKVLDEMIQKTTGAEQEGYKKQKENLEAANIAKQMENRRAFNQYYEELKANNSKIAENINMITGEVIVEEEAINNQKRLVNMEDTLVGMNLITETGYYQLYNTTTKTMDNVAVVVDEKTGLISAAFNATRYEGGEAMDGMMDKAYQLTRVTEYASSSMSSNWGYLATATVDSNGKIITKNHELVGSLTDVTNAEDGTRIGIINLNGTPIKVTVNKDGAISNLNDILNKVDQVRSISQKGLGLTFGFTLGGGPNSTPNHNFNGQKYVPYDGYIARLHKGERVLTAEENKNYNTNNNSTTVNFNGNYNFNDKNDIDYFLNQAALKLKEAR